MKKLILSAIAVVTMAFTSQVYAQKNPMVGGAEMYATKDIVDNAVNSKDHTTLVAAVKAAGLVETLKSAGPFTVFAPTNEAFAKLPAGTVETLVKPENKATLTKILTYHVVAGKMDSKAIAKAIKAGGGKAELTTVEGEKLSAHMMGNKLMLTDAKGGMSTVTIADVNQSNGVIHVIDTVLMPQ
ncbi:fasciclin domain-containing protein [Pedobacter lithocola]|uniref:Fasciclin domain-containing protein n=2 Tax=Pedobacter TaxID=84567 RepID=A0A3N0BNB2_9SPHI|nr:fasciclin domain-containing protein [Pedobacter jejuensis]RNL50237.1 fasciclin domain-containing protein [Pedobacter jejuensis]